MTLTCLRARCDSPVRAEAELAARLKYRFDVQLVPYRTGTVLLPPHLLHALEDRFGAAATPGVLASAGLHEAAPEPVAVAIEWLLKHATDWAREVEPCFDDSADAEARTWHLDMCRVRQAWAATDGPYSYEWGDIAIGQIDTGYTEHPAFGFPDSPSIDRGRARSFESGAPPGDGRDPLTGGSGGHGTSSGSLITAFDLSTPCLGVAPRVPVVPVRIDDCVVIDQRADEFEAAVHYLVDQARVQVINVSMGTFGRFTAPPPIRRAVDHAYERGVIMIGAAGNVPVPEWPAFPARLARCIAVAGVTRECRRWALSSYGSWIDFSGPARNVWRAAARGPGNYGFTGAWGGTTFAAAMTSGAAALWLLAHASEIIDRYPEPWQRVEAFRLMARRTALVPDGWNDEYGLGAGVLNAAGLVDGRHLPMPEELCPGPKAA
jgi:hypothetical protein